MASVVAGGSYVTVASPVSSETWTRVTPLTSSSADRTAEMQPSQVMPSTASVTVCGLGGSGSSAPEQAAVSVVPTITNQLRRAISIIDLVPFFAILNPNGA